MKDLVGLELREKDKDRFQIEEYLGGGRFGQVYRAVSLKTGTTVAIKLAAPEKLNDPFTEAVKSLRNETRVAMTEVSHPNVVRIFYVDQGTDKSVGPYVIMEYVEGGTLQDEIRKRQKGDAPFTLKETVVVP